MPRALNLLLSLTFATMFFAGLAQQTSQAQTFTVIHNFTGESDGGNPDTGTMDATGTMYGTTQLGGAHQRDCNELCGTVFQLSPRNGSWILSTLYSFSGVGIDGASPQHGVVFGPDGALYGTTLYGGCNLCSGTVFRLTPRPTFCRSVQCEWSRKTLHAFGGGTDGASPSSGVTFDSSGNLYGTTGGGGGGTNCGAGGCGTVYEVSPAGGSWQEQVLYAFQGDADGDSPEEGVVLNSAGNIFGTCCTSDSGYPNGAVYELTPAGGGYSKSVIYSFTGGSGGSWPYGLIFDASGNLYGATRRGGSGDGGLVYELVPQGGSWSFVPLYALYDPAGDPGIADSLTMDAAGNLYGTTQYGGRNELGTVFKLTHTLQLWTYTLLHEFTGGADGGLPGSRVVLDAQGNVYGTTLGGGAFQQGVAFKIEQ